MMSNDHTPHLGVERIGNGHTVLFLNTDGDMPACIRCAGDYRAFNALIGAGIGDVVRLGRVAPPGGVASKGRVFLWVDDEGLLRSRMVNRMATRLAGRPIVGDALLLGENDDGETRSLEDYEMLEMVRCATRLEVRD